MARFCIESECIEVPDGDAIIEAAEDLGVPFGCQAGDCATCLIQIVEGLENLAPKTNAEISMGLGPKHRLACQAHIRSGHVVAGFC